MDKIEQAQQILFDLGLPEAQRGKIAALTFLALCGIRKNSSWKDAKRQSLTLSKGIMDFVNENYDQDYKPNTRESFRKSALNPFVEQQVIDLNPDNPNLPPQSSKTHYAIKKLTLETVRSYGSRNWQEAKERFKRLQFVENIEETALVTHINILNYKSIENMELELGRFNVLIGANGSGKSNILEAIAMLGASKGNDLDLDGLMSRGVRVAKPTLTLSSFLGKQLKKQICIDAEFTDEGTRHLVKSTFQSTNLNDLYSKWIEKETEEHIPEVILDYVHKITNTREKLESDKLIDELNSLITQRGVNASNKYTEILAKFLIYNLSTQTLRGLDASSRKVPLGIYGEGLDVLISNFNSYETTKLLKCKLFFNWLDKIAFDKQDEFKLSGYKLGKSTSTLYFHDRYMQKSNNLFSAENANEGILHVIFYLALFISNKTPDFFAIDNIETALNPKLCRALIKELTNLSKERGKQTIITTHNPAILDGLNLNDDSQRLFEVYRTDEGATRVRRIKFKKGAPEKNLKLSEMWMEGLLGAVPQSF
ncbi:Type II restriction enzyme BsuBI [Fulvivirga imtechensis AK7]|uniref:Type II restriction enzyme BsuBI n=1 Tax=Fulvivirga imtechensis AK7 TaxID=1237149 RepID=L8JNN3_9BACT|nr:AAA family ATPase [Fulvivirga imtechensis]ELR69763.1 Type II restriction enzyme BsuBI [Fulvivirga imtechensis AK7]